MFSVSLRLKRPELEAEHYPRFHEAEHYPRFHDVVHGHREVVVYSLGATELFAHQFRI
jgi:hypothetical protein